MKISGNFIDAHENFNCQLKYANQRTKAGYVINSRKKYHPGNLLNVSRKCPENLLGWISRHPE